MKKLVSFFLTLMLVVALAACQDITTTETSTTTETTTGETTVITTTEDQTTTTAVPTTTEDQTTTTEEPVDLLALIDELKTHYADTLEDETFVATEDLPLLTTIGSVEITWVSNNTNYLENDGTIHRPTYTEGDQTVILTATITDGTDSESYMFFVTIGAMEKSDQERANDVFTVITAFPSKEKWTAADTLEFLTQGQDAEGVIYDVTWFSSHPAIISTDGTITQPEGADVEVRLTAQIEINDAVYSRTISFTVAMRAPVDATVDTIAEAFAEGEDAYVKIQGVTIIAIDSDGNVFFTDGTDTLFIYGAGSLEVEVGGVYDITGVVAYYYNAGQLVGNNEQPLFATASDAAVSEAPVATVDDIYGIITDNQVPTTANPFFPSMYRVSASVYYDDSWGNYSVFLVPTDYDFDEALDTPTQPNGDSIMIYYKSDMNVLSAFHGQNITIDLLLIGYRTDKLVWYGNFFGTEADVDFYFATEQEAIDAAFNKLSFPKYVLENTTIDLPASEFGVSLSYASDDETIINSTTGAIDLTGVTTETDVTITVTATYGDTTDTMTVVIPVGMPALTTIDQALAADNGYLFKVQGTVVAGGYYRTFFIQDTTGNIALYVRDSALITLLENNVGNVVEILGTRGQYAGLNQLSVMEATYVSDDTAPTATNIDGMTLDEAGILAYQGQLVELTEMVVTDVYTDTYGNITVTLMRISDLEEIKMKWDSRYDLPQAASDALTGLAVNDKVTVQTVLAWYYGPQLYMTTTTVITESVLTDVDKATLDAVALDFGGDLYQGADITLPDTGDMGSTITWAITADLSSSASITGGVLTLVRPAADAVVTIEATVTMNAAVETVEFTFNLFALTDLGDVPSLTLDDKIVVHGNVYAIIGNGFFIEDATGKLFIYTDDATIPYVLGDEVELIGFVGQYKSAFQLVDVLDMPAAISQSNDVTQSPIVYEDGVTILDPGYTYTVYGEVAIEGSYNNVYIYINATDKFEIYYKSPSTSIDSLEALEGQNVTVDLIYYNAGYYPTFVFTGLAGDIDIVTDFSTLATIADEEFVYLQGVVAGFDSNGIFLQDAAGLGIYMFRAAGYNDDTVSLGDEVIYYGELDTYYGVRQLAYGADRVSTVSTGNALVVTTYTQTELGDADIAADTNILISATALEITYISASSLSFEVIATDTSTVEYRYYFEEEHEWLGDVYEVGDTLDMQFIISTYYSSQAYWKVVSVTVADMTEQQALDADVADVPTELTLTGDFVIPDAPYGSTYEVTNVSTELTAYVDATTTPGTLLVTQPVDADVTGTVTVRVTQGSLTPVDVTINVTVAKYSDVTTYVETFTNFSLSGTSYAAGSFVGDNSITWAYTESRGDFSLDGQAIMLDKDGDGSSLSATIQGGIGSFSINFYDAYSGAAVVEVYINGTLVGTSPAFDDDGDGSVYATFTIENINIAGEFTIEILAGGAQMVLDNLTWTTYAAS